MDGIFIKVFINIVEHPKMLNVPRAHRWAFIDLLAYCKRNMTDGFLPASEAVLERLQVTPAEVASLLSSGLLDQAENGYIVHDYADYQVSKDLIESRRESGRRGGQESGKVRAAKAKSKQESEATKQVEALASEATNQTQTQTQTQTSSRAIAHRAGERVTAFDTFWSMYPYKVGKRNAQAAYKRALTRASADAITEGLQRLLPSWTDPRYIPHPTTWLNRDGWNDAPTPMRRGSVSTALAAVHLLQTEPRWEIAP
jgi:hypothetical protein